MSLFLLAYARAGNVRQLRRHASTSKDAGEEAKGASACFAREQGVLSSLIVICLLWDMSLSHLHVRAQEPKLKPAFIRVRGYKSSFI